MSVRIAIATNGVVNIPVTGLPTGAFWTAGFVYITSFANSGSSRVELVKLEGGTGYDAMTFGHSSSTARSVGALSFNSTSVSADYNHATDFVGRWVPFAALFAADNNRTIYTESSLDVFLSANNTSSRATSGYTTLTLASGAIPNVSPVASEWFFSNLAVYNGTPTTAQVQEYFASGQVTGLTPLVDLPLNADWGGSNISNEGSLTFDFAAPVTWTYSSNNPNFSSVTIGSSPANTRTTESRTIRITVPTTAPTTVNTNIKINSAGNAAITPTACTLVSGLTYDITFAVPDAYAGLPYSNTGYPIIVTTTDGTATSGNVPYLPVTGNAFVNPTVAVPGDIVVLSGTFGTDDQLEYGTAGGTVSIDTSCVITYTGANPAGVSFSVRAWDNADDTWGSFATMNFGGALNGLTSAGLTTAGLTSIGLTGDLI